MSHFSNAVASRLTLFASGIEEFLQADGHSVGSAMSLHPAFGARFVESPLARSLVRDAAFQQKVDGLHVIPKSNGGAEVVIVHDGIERHFRLRGATKDRNGWWDVRASEKSIFALPSKDEPTLFDGPEADDITELPTEYEQWVLAYILHPGTHTFQEVAVGRVVGFMDNKTNGPRRLKLENVTPVAYDAPLPEAFETPPDDLDLPDEEEGSGDDRDH